MSVFGSLPKIVISYSTWPSTIVRSPRGNGNFTWVSRFSITFTYW